MKTNQQKRAKAALKSDNLSTVIYQRGGIFGGLTEKVVQTSAGPRGTTTRMVRTTGYPTP